MTTPDSMFKGRAVYLDNSATTRVKPQVAQLMFDVMTKDFGNPSSLYRIGLDAEKIIKKSRETVADALGVESSEIWFTSCGTESDNTVIRGVWESRKKRGKRIITSAVEHPAVLEPCRYLEAKGADVVYLPVTKDGIVDMDALKAALTPDTILVSVMHVNNESGAVNPLMDIRKEINRVNPEILFHTDGVQSFEKLEFTVDELGVDFFSLSGHKIHASKGIGALYVRKGIYLPPFMLGGGQERGNRSGTEAVPQIAGLGKAVELAEENKKERLEKLALTRNHLKERIREYISYAKINSPDGGCPSILSISLPGCRGEVLLHMLEEKGIYVSTGSACSSHSGKKGSHVLNAMGLRPEEIEGTLRLSLSDENTPEDMDYVAATLQDCAYRHRKLLKLNGRFNK